MHFMEILNTYDGHFYIQNAKLCYILLNCLYNKNRSSLKVIKSIGFIINHLENIPFFVLKRNHLKDTK